MHPSDEHAQDRNLREAVEILIPTIEAYITAGLGARRIAEDILALALQCRKPPSEPAAPSPDEREALPSLAEMQERVEDPAHDECCERCGCYVSGVSAALARLRVVGRDAEALRLRAEVARLRKSRDDVLAILDAHDRQPRDLPNAIPVHFSAVIRAALQPNAAARSAEHPTPEPSKESH